MTRKIPIPLKSTVGGPKGPRKPRNGCSRTNQPYDQESSQPPPGSMTNWEQSSGNQKTDGPAKLQIDHWNHREIVTKKKNINWGPPCWNLLFKRRKIHREKHRWDLWSMLGSHLDMWDVRSSPQDSQPWKKLTGSHGSYQTIKKTWHVSSRL